MRIHTIIAPFILAIVAFMLPRCSSTEWDDVPQPITSFLNEYFPEQAVSDYRYDGSTYHVKLRNSAALTFDENYSWTSVNGYGNILPEIFLFDQLPPALYSYLQELSLTNQVYSVTRDNIDYRVLLLDSSVTYDIDTGIVTTD